MSKKSIKQANKDFPRHNIVQHTMYKYTCIQVVYLNIACSLCCSIGMELHIRFLDLEFLFLQARFYTTFPKTVTEATASGLSHFFKFLLHRVIACSIKMCSMKKCSYHSHIL